MSATAPRLVADLDPYPCLDDAAALGASDPHDAPAGGQPSTFDRSVGPKDGTGRRRSRTPAFPPPPPPGTNRPRQRRPSRPSPGRCAHHSTVMPAFT
jgi:hypothetical protein